MLRMYSYAIVVVYYSVVVHNNRLRVEYVQSAGFARIPHCCGSRIFPAIQYLVSDPVGYLYAAIMDIVIADYDVINMQNLNTRPIRISYLIAFNYKGIILCSFLMLNVDGIMHFIRRNKITDGQYE